MKHQRLLLRSTHVGFKLSPAAERMLQKIPTATYEPRQIAALLGYMSEEFYYNGANPNLCNRWLRHTLYSLLGHTGLSTTEVDILAQEHLVNIFK